MGISKSSVRPVVLHTFAVLFTERTSGCLHAYVHTKNSGVHPFDLAYTRPWSISVWLLFSKGLRSRWVNTKGLGLC
jgi:hypothetical protein